MGQSVLPAASPRHCHNRLMTRPSPDTMGVGFCRNQPTLVSCHDPTPSTLPLSLSTTCSWVCVVHAHTFAGCTENTPKTAPSTTVGLQAAAQSAFIQEPPKCPLRVPQRSTVFLCDSKCVAAHTREPASLTHVRASLPVLQLPPCPDRPFQPVMQSATAKADGISHHLHCCMLFLSSPKPAHPGSHHLAHTTQHNRNLQTTLQRLYFSCT